MDDTDRKLLMLIVTNPRISFQSLARSLGITKQAIHHRLQALKDSGVIGEMTADISVPYLSGVPVLVYGVSKARSIRKVFNELGQSEFTRRIIAGCMDYVYVNGILRDISELDGFVDFVKRAAKIDDVIVGVYAPAPGLMPNYVVDGITVGRPIRRQLSKLDLRIIISLKKDVRKRVEDIAKEVRVSAKTVKKHMDAMMSEGMLELHVRTDSSIAGDLMYVAHLTVRDGADREAIGKRLLSKYPFKDDFFVIYSNMPKELGWIFWTGDIVNVRRVAAAADEEEDIEAVKVNLGYMMRICATWQDKLPERLLQEAEKGGGKSVSAQ